MGSSGGTTEVKIITQSKINFDFFLCSFLEPFLNVNTYKHGEKKKYLQSKHNELQLLQIEKGKI